MTKMWLTWCYLGFNVAMSHFVAGFMVKAQDWATLVAHTGGNPPPPEAMTFLESMGPPYFVAWGLVLQSWGQLLIYWRRERESTV